MMVLNGVLIGVIGTACLSRRDEPCRSGASSRRTDRSSCPAIFIAGGAGLILGRGLLDPGMLPRREALAESGGLAIRLLLGVLPMLVIAGVIEGFISPVAMPAVAEVRHRRRRCSCCSRST